MRIITKRALTESWKKYPEAKSGLAIWEERIKHINFKNHAELQDIFPDADYIPNGNFRHLTIFNIRQNAYRLGVDVFFSSSLVFIKWFGPHGSYDHVNFKRLTNGGFVLC